MNNNRKRKRMKISLLPPHPPPASRCYRLNKPCRPPTEILELLHHPSTSTSSSSSPLLDLVIERSDFRPMVSLYMQAFHQLREEGLVDRRRTIGLLRMWVNLGLLFGGGSDPTLGMFSQVCRSFVRSYLCGSLISCGVILFG